MSYIDYMNGKIKVSDKNLSRAVSVLSAVANKRLKRLESKGWNYGTSVKEDTISGVKKFAARGKSREQLMSEFKRVKQFLDSPLSTIKGARKQAREFGVKTKEVYSLKNLRDTQRISERSENKDEYVTYYDPVSSKDLKRAIKAERARRKRLGLDEQDSYDDEWYTEWYGGISFYNYLTSNGYYKPSQLDSDQGREVATRIVAKYSGAFGSLDDMVNEFLEEMGIERNAYEEEQQKPQPEGGTSSFFGEEN